MYLSFYGLAEKPFSQTPDPKFLYWNDAYRETIASLRYGIQERKGFVTMIGEAGTGKTTLLRKLLDDLGPDVVSVFLFNPNATFEEILEYTLSELGIPAASGRKLAMLQRLNDFLLAAFNEGKNTILVIDEAQDLETEVLESLRLLSNLETAKEKILQIVLAGQPELATRLAQPNLRQLKQRIAVRCRVEPLGRNELAEFISTRLTVAGGRPDLFAAETLEPIWGFAHGIPRLVNTVCDNALLVGYALGRSTIDAGIVAEVVSDLGKLDAPAAPPAPAPLAAPAATLEASAVSATDASAGAPAAAAPAPRSPAAPAAAGEPTATPSAPRPAAQPPAQHAEATRGARRSSPLAAPAPRRRRGTTVVAVAAVLLLALAAGWLAGAFEGLRPRVRGWLLAAGVDVAGFAANDASTPVGASSARADDGPLAGSEPAPAAPAPAAVAAAPPPAARPADAAPDAPAPAVELDARPADAAPADAQAAIAPATEAAEPPSRGRAEAASGADEGERIAASPPRDPVPAPVTASNGADPAAAPDSPEVAEPAAAGGAAPAAAAAAAFAAQRPATRLAALPSAADAERDRQDLQPRRRRQSGGKRIVVQRGDTLMNLATREYGAATYTTLDVVRAANPGIRDVNRIIAGEELIFPDPGPKSRVIEEREGLSVLIATTPILDQAQQLQRVVGSRYRMPVELQPIALGDGRNLYRVSLRQLPDKAQALAIAESLGSILEDPS